MDAQTLTAAMVGLDSARAAQLTPGGNEALLLADCTTVNRAAMFLAELRQESISLTASQELGSDAYLQGQAYWPYIGRSFIQITWAYNYQAFGQWAHTRGLIDDPNYFVNNPTALAGDRWAWIGPVWFWTQHNLNAFADADDVDGCSRAINGGDNGLQARRDYYNALKTLGTRLLPEDKHTATVTPAHKEDDDMFMVKAIDPAGKNVPGHPVLLRAGDVTMGVHKPTFLNLLRDGVSIIGFQLEDYAALVGASVKVDIVGDDADTVGA